MFLRKPRTFYYPGQIIIKCTDTVVQIQSPGGVMLVSSSSNLADSFVL